MNTVVMNPDRQPIQDWLLAGIVHELNNPLTTILGFSEMLLRDGAVDATRLEKIHAEAARSVRIVQNVLRLARADHGGCELIDVNDSIRNTIELAEYPLRSKGVEVELDLSGGQPKVSARAGELNQVFLNLVTNSAQAISGARPSGTIRITSVVVRDRVRISVSDDGPGIRKSDIDQIFEPFFTTKETGTGLGLSLSRKIIREIGGEMWASNKQSGGATFTIELLLVSKTKDSKASPSDESRLMTTERSALIVDDEDHITELVQDVLGDSGYHTDRAGDGSPAIELLKKKEYDIVICDLHMPGLDGRGLIEWVRSNRTNTRILLLSGDVVRNDAREFAKAYGAHFLSKPFSISELKKAVQRLFS